jgi:hypothetical protein
MREVPPHQPRQTMTALTLNIPDWIFCGPFWAGFGIAVVLAVAFFFWLVSQCGPRF